MILHGFPILLLVPAVDWPRPQRAACWERRRHPVAFGIVDTMRINPNGLYMLSIAAYRVPRVVGNGGLLVSERARSVDVRCRPDNRALRPIVLQVANDVLLHAASNHARASVRTVSCSHGARPTWWGRAADDISLTAQGATGGAAGTRWSRRSADARSRSWHNQQAAGERCQGAAEGLLQGTDPRGRGELVGDGLHGNTGGQVVMQQARGVESLAAIVGPGRVEPGSFTRIVYGRHVLECRAGCAWK